MRRPLAVAALVLAGLLVVGPAAPIAQATGPDPQAAGGLFIQADIVGGTCTLQGRFAPGDRVVFRARVVDAQTGEMAPNATVTIRLDDGTVLSPHFSAHPAQPPQTDEFWATSWTVPEDAPAGIVRYTIEAVDGARSGRFEPFNVESSLLTIVPAR